MFKLYKKLSMLDYILILFIIGFTVLQVYFTMTLVDYVQGIIKAITYVNYHNNPASSSEINAIFIACGSSWDNVKAAAAAMGEAGDTFVKIADASTADIWFNGGMMLALAASTMLVQAIISILASKVAADLSTKIRTDLYYHVEKFSLAEIDKFQTASLVTRTTNDIQHIQMANLLTMRMIFQAPITAIWAICKLQATSFELTITTAIAVGVLVVVIAAIMLVTLPKFKIMQKLTDNLNLVTRDNLVGIRIVRAYNAENFSLDKFETENKKYTRAQLFTGSAMAIMMPTMTFVMNALTIAMYYIGSKLINKGSTDYASVTSFVMLGTQLVMAFVMLMMLFIMWPRAIVAAGRINEVLKTESDIADSKNPVEFKSRATIEFKNVSFKYGDSEDNILDNISFRANEGETIAIIGATSSGKTTLVNLIARLYDATEGEVLVDDVNVKDVRLKDLRDRIGFVPQKGFLFNGSIKENIAFGADQIEMSKVEKAAETACAKEFIMEKSENYDFEISQGGKNVSGGQRQRLCIARCVYKSPEIYVFDDSFSALDYKTDKKVRENLSKLDQKATKVIVAQRIGTIMDADRILVLEAGKVVGNGRHKELLESCDVYREIALSQLSREELGL